MPEPPKSDSAFGRRVVTGIDSTGRSCVIEDGPSAIRVRRPTGTLVVDLWRVDELPARPTDPSSLTDEVVLAPPPHGLVVRVTTFPPDSEISDEAVAEYAAKMSEIYGEQDAPTGASSVPGMHVTETIDIMTVVDGELHMIMEAGETCLRSGDSVVQRGTRHAWQNRSDRPVRVVTTMIPVVRE